MKVLLTMAALVMLTSFGNAQSSCRETTSNSQQHRDGYTLFNVSLPAEGGSVAAQALIPDDKKNTSAVVFSLSALVASEPDRVIEMMPTATELVKAGKSAIVIQRKLTWPLIDQSVGTMQSTVLCAQQWLSAHASVNPDKWLFVGPKTDVPTFEQLKSVGDNGSMTFNWGFSIGGPNENTSTDGVLRRGMLTAEQLTGNIGL